MLAFRNELEYRKVDRGVNSCNDPSTSCEKLVSFGPVTPEFTRLECVYQEGESSMRGRPGNAGRATLVAIQPDNCHPSSCTPYLYVILAKNVRAWES